MTSEQSFVEDENLLQIKIVLFQIKYVSAMDAGKYECQVSTVPKISRWIDLVVVVPKVKKSEKGKHLTFGFAGSNLWWAGYICAGGKHLRTGVCDQPNNCLTKGLD